MATIILYYVDLEIEKERKREEREIVIEYDAKLVAYEHIKHGWSEHSAYKQIDLIDTFV